VNIWRVYAAMAVKTRVPALRRRELCIRLRIGSSTRHVWIADRSELDLIESVLADGEYGAVADDDAQVILDAGSNIGISVLWFRALHPLARIVAVEPNPAAYWRLRKNVGVDPFTTCIQAAITPVSGPTMLITGPLSWDSRVDDAAGASATPVLGMTLDRLVASLDLQHIDVMKVDIEGMEWKVLPTAGCLSITNAVIGEMHRGDDAPSDPDAFFRQIGARAGLRQVPEVASHLFLLRRPVRFTGMTDAIEGR
jgi:FkbM family methyltransferase